MSQYYCHVCSTNLGIVNPEVPTEITDTSYQLVKFIKHTAPTGTYDINSVFSDPSTQAYRGYIVTGTLSGYVQIDDQGRKNLLWVAGKEIGATIDKGKGVTPADTVVVVFPEDEGRIHAFPAPSTRFGQESCLNCGIGLFTTTSS